MAGSCRYDVLAPPPLLLKASRWQTTGKFTKISSLVGRRLLVQHAHGYYDYTALLAALAFSPVLLNACAIMWLPCWRVL
jgi:hypothetical protein